MGNLSVLSVAELADGICLRAGRIAAAEAELLLWVAEFDRREGWAGSGLLSCAHWLSWKVGLSPGAAREQVRVARRLPELPELAAAFADGRVSYSKVRAITRIAEPADGVDWVELARCSTASQLEELVRGMRRAKFAELAESDPEEAAWVLRTRVRHDEHGNFSLTISGPAEWLPVVQAGIEAKKAELQRERDAETARAAAEAAAEAGPDVPAGTFEPEPMPEASGVPAGTPPVEDLDEQAPGWPAGTTLRDVLAATDRFAAASEQRLKEWQEQEGITLEPVELAVTPVADVPAGTPTPRVTDAEALLALAQDALAVEQTAHPSIARRRRAQLTAQVDPLSGWGRLPGGELLPPTSLKQVMRTLPGRGGVLRLRPLTDADLRRHDLGRGSREVSAALRELLGAIDGERCRMPGCTRRKKLHAHHVRFWSDGGPTDLGNLVLVCARHHTLIHSQGFILVLHPDRRLEVTTADGVRLLHHPAQPWGDPAALSDRDVTAGTLPPDHVEPRLDLRYAVGVLMSQAA